MVVSHSVFVKEGHGYYVVQCAIPGNFHTENDQVIINFTCFCSFNFACALLQSDAVTGHICRRVPIVRCGCRAQ